MRATAGLLLVLVGCTGQDPPPLRALGPEIAVAPATLDFGDRAVPLEHAEVIFVTNGGKAPLEVELALEVDDEPAFTLPVTAATVDPGASAELEVRFAPPSFLEYGAVLVLTSNDDDDPELRVPVVGRGVTAPLPDVALSHTLLDFGEGTTPRTEVVFVRNVGDDDLELGEVRRGGSPRFALLTEPAHTRIAPGNELPVVVTYTPEGEDGDDGTLTFLSNDPDEPEVTLLLLGNGGADYDYPEAVIDCPAGPVDPPGFVDLDGAASHDPEGHLPLTYTWTLISRPTTPAGVALSDAYLTNAVGETTSLWADAVGTYDVELVVENAVGVRSAPARCRVMAQPKEELLIELTWSTTRADLDLHLARGDAGLFDADDASFCNRAADWGVPGDRADDPRLDLDDQSGLGPENISIDAPANGTYDVRVHYFDDHGDDLVTATVRIYLQGALQPALQSSRNLRRNEVWDVARVHWPPTSPPGAFSRDPYPAPRRTCR